MSSTTVLSAMVITCLVIVVLVALAGFADQMALPL